MRRKLKVKMGYANAYDYLYIYVQNIKDKELKREMKDVLNDFAYCVNKTEKCLSLENALRIIMETEYYE